MESVLRKVHETLQQNFGRAGTGARFFSGTRRGEGAELQAELASLDVARQKNAVKRIIANMTLGREVSYLFVDVVKLGHTRNLELKKLVYLYILSTAKLQPDKALLAVNTLLQDADNPSPIVRALALRTMLCLRVSSVVEYTIEPLRRAVADGDSYVCKTAAIALGKLFHYNMGLFYDQGFGPELTRLLATTRAPMVGSNAAAIVSEINDYGVAPLETSAETVDGLLLYLPNCTEWGQVYLLELLADYKPKDSEAAERIVAHVLPRLGHTNPSVVMAAIKVIANFANRCLPESIERYALRVNSALLTLMSSSDPETQYVVCKNVHALLVVFPGLLRSNFDAFYVRFSDPPYVKLEKLRLLLKLVTPATAPLIVKELAEYSTEVDPLFVEEVVQSVAALALKVEAVAGQCTTLLKYILAKRPELLPQVLVAAMNVVRKYPEHLLLDHLLREHEAEAVAEEQGKVALVWMLGEYGDKVDQGTATLQHFVQTIMDHEPSVQLAVLSATIKGFLRDPAHMERTLHEVLETITARSDDPDLRDRAFAYWRLLSKGIDVGQMSSIVHGQIAPVNVDRTFSDAMTMADLKKSINTAAVVFGKPYHAFLPPYGFSEGRLDGDEEDEEEEVAAADDADVVPDNNNSIVEDSAAANTKGEGSGGKRIDAAIRRDSGATGAAQRADYDALWRTPAGALVGPTSSIATTTVTGATSDPLDDLFSAAPVGAPPTSRTSITNSTTLGGSPAGGAGGGSIYHGGDTVAHALGGSERALHEWNSVPAELEAVRILPGNVADHARVASVLQSMDMLDIEAEQQTATAHNIYGAVRGAGGDRAPFLLCLDSSPMGGEAVLRVRHARGASVADAVMLELTRRLGSGSAVPPQPSASTTRPSGVDLDDLFS